MSAIEPSSVPSIVAEESAPRSKRPRAEHLEERVTRLEIQNIEQEYRFFAAILNLYQCFVRPNEVARAEKRVAALRAVLFTLFFRRPTVVLTIGLGGLLALQANALLNEQNEKIETQNYLNLVAAELSEGQRNSQFIQLLPGILGDVQRRLERPGVSAGSADLPVLTDELYGRIAALSATFQPYKWIEGESEIQRAIDQSGALRRFLVWIVEAFSFGAGQSNFEVRKLPTLSSDRRSPERGQMLSSLHGLNIDLSPLLRWNADFSYSYLPYARLQKLTFLRVEGPQASQPLRLMHAMLRSSDLSFALLSSADFSYVNLENATAVMSDFSSTNFTSANLRGAVLDSSNFASAVLRGADLTGASLRNANLKGVDLREVKPGTLTAAQLNAACLHRESTLLPAVEGFDWDEYRLPDGTAERWLHFEN